MTNKFEQLLPSAGRKAMKVFSAVTIFTMVLATGLVAPVNYASAALVPGGAVGPIAPAGGLGAGFPLWYQDQNGLALELMEAADGFGISAAPTAGFGQTVGFGAEGFYWSADALPTNPAGVGITVLALEAAFAGESAVDGEQSVFGRLRHRYDVDVPGEYTITHPFGTDTFTVDAVIVGTIEINETSDIGCFALGTGISSCNPNTPPGNPNNFGLALQSRIGPFLTWDTFDPATTTDPSLNNPANPTKKYIGNPNVAHAIKGSPTGNNFVRVDGPAGSFGGAGFIQQNLFTVTGRVAVLDTVAPVITTATSTVAIGATNTVLTANVTDNLGVRPLTSAVKMDLGPLGNTLSASMSGAQEVGTLGSSASGSGTFTIDTAANTLAFNITFSGLPAGDVETTPHIHNGALGTNGAMVFELPTGATKTGTWNYPENLEAEILAGRTYVQIHSVLFPSGAIRGQILPTTNIQNMILTAGTATNGTWSIIVPSMTKLGTFNLPITATDGSNIASGNLVLVVNALTSVGVTPAASTIIGTGTTTLTAAPLDNNGAPFTGATVTWSSSNPAAASVNSATGLVTGVAPGSTVITATAVSGTVTVTGTSSVTVLSASPVFSSVTVTPAAGTIIFSSPTLTRQLTASAIDQFGNALAVQPSFTWASIDTAVATVTPTTGLVGAVATGTTAVTAQATVNAVTLTGTSTISVVIEPQVLTSVTLTPAPSSVVRGATTQLTGTGLDQFGGAMAPQPVIAFTSSNPAVATVDATTGLVTGVATGTATITAQSGVLSATSALTVTAAPQVLTTIAVTPSPANVIVSGTRQLAASGVDQFGDPMVPQPAFTWSSNNPGIVTVNAGTGLLTGGAATGTAIITVSSAAISATTTVNVVTDAVAPVITVTGANPASVTVGAAYTDAGATALDAVDGAVTVTSTSTVNTAVAGAYTVTYTAADAAGNIATATRTVNVSAPAPAPAGGGGGGGGGAVAVPTTVVANNARLVVNSGEAGIGSRNFGNGVMVSLEMPQGAVSVQSRFDLGQAGLRGRQEPIGAEIVVDRRFEIIARDNKTEAPITSLNKNVKITIATPELAAADKTDLGVYFFDEGANLWRLVPNAVFAGDKVTFEVNHLTDFAIFRAAGLPATLEARRAEGVENEAEDNQRGRVLGIKIRGADDIRADVGMEVEIEHGIAFLKPHGGKARDLALEKRVDGKILLQVQKHGEAWWVEPNSKKVVLLGRPDDAFQAMREFGLGITNADLDKIALAGGAKKADNKLAQRLAGRIVLQVQSHGEAWYIDPVTLERHFLGRPADAFSLMRKLGLGITDDNLAKLSAERGSNVAKK